ncbi:HipA family kinase [Algoriphagus winogradskyi]|uniref:HipA-like kinase domain-containing protein n=1 Tax=Algoriphagus winogradskyi TaxID=237017 RepID=A0ABY1PNQ4_9BACT|nr:HipA family kinase [Algoriphagus winogradskyi]SMP36602.1 hypothetical protein SAMN06265367_1171 [Algoriphagus winogradskyi]
MVVRRIKSQLFIEELETDGHHPLKIQADDGDIYICKYLTQLQREEIDCLFYELVSHDLLSWLGIRSPEIALMEVDPLHLDSKKIFFNKRLLRQKTWVLAVKWLQDTELLTSLTGISKRSLLKKFIDPYLLIKIALFDLWVDNVDRGVNREGLANYNLLIHARLIDKQVKFTWVPIDHAFCFGGVTKLRILNPSFLPEVAHKLPESPYFQKYYKLLNKEDLHQIIDNFLPLSSLSGIEEIVNQAYAQIPVEWEVPKHLPQRLINFLIDEARVQRARYLIKDRLR